MTSSILERAPMLRNGEYVAWFRTSRGGGTGRVHFRDGEFSGADSVLSYAGTYAVDGPRFTGTVRTWRHAPGQQGLLGMDEAELTLEGVSHGKVAMCSGCFDGTSEIVLEVTLIRVQAEEPKEPLPFRPEDFRPERLPKGNVR
jgi:hypothetical protein